MRLALLICFSLFAFAANAIFTRMAISLGETGPAGFMFFRTFFAALILLPVFLWQSHRLPRRPKSLLGPIGLGIYMASFSLVYQSVDAGFGSLILFGVLQLALFGASAVFERRPSVKEVIGALIAIAGLAYSLLNGHLEVRVLDVALIVIAALGWAMFTWAGKGHDNPLEPITISFILILPFVAVGYLPFTSEPLTTRGLMIAAVSGAITSGLGYVIWYAALAEISRTAAGVWQLTVPLIAILLGAFTLGEEITARILIGAFVVIGGVSLALLSRQKAD